MIHFEARGTTGTLSSLGAPVERQSSSDEARHPSSATQATFWGGKPRGRTKRRRKTAGGEERGELRGTGEIGKTMMEAVDR